MATKSFELPLQKITDVDGHSHPWYMAGSATIDDNGHLRTRTRLESHVMFSGFTGGMVVALLDDAGEIVASTPALKYGVDGYAVPPWLPKSTPSPRNAAAEFRVDPAVYAKTDKISITLFHVPTPRLLADIASGAKVIEDLVRLIVRTFGGSSSTVLSELSTPLAKKLTPVERGERRPGI